MKIQFVYIFLILTNIFVNSYTNLFAQDNIFSIKGNTGVHGGGFYTDIQAGGFFISSESSFLSFPTSITSICAGIETNYLFKNDFRIVPKISFEQTFEGLFMAGLQARFYPAQDMDFKNASVQVCPQVGISFFGAGTFSLGYNIGLSNVDMVPKLGFQVNIGVNLPLLMR